jgi:hypothetical protein
MSARCRHAASFALLTAVSVAVVSDEGDSGKADGKQEDHNDAIQSLISRPFRWVEPVGKRANESGTSKSSDEKARTLLVDDIPPAFVPIPCKPIFFDIANNYIDYPDLDERAGIAKVRKAAPASEAASAGGLAGVAQNIFGWFSR